MTTTDEKRCSMCKQFKPLEAFHWGGKSKTTRAAACKACSNKKRGEKDKAERLASKRAREEAALHISHTICRSCKIAMLPNGDVDNRPWAGDASGCESCGRKGLLGRKLTAKV